MNTYYVCIK